MDKLTLTELSAYLPYNVQFKDLTGAIHELDVESIAGVVNEAENLNTIRLLLRPLSDLTKEITHNGETFVPSRELNKILNNGKYSSHFNNVVIESGELGVEFGDYSTGYYLNDPIKVINNLHEWHFDTENLIGRNLAIDINTVKEGGE